MTRPGASVASLALGGAFAAIAFVAEGGAELGANTAVEITLILLGAALVAVALVRGPRRPLYGAAALAAFAALVAVTALSVLWSSVPDESWIEADRTLAYFAAFAGALAVARLRPLASPVLLRAVVIAGVVIVGYALTARIWPGALADAEVYARIGEPYGYWNAIGTTAAMTIPAALWLGARRSGHQPANALAFPALGVLFVGLFMTASRGAIIAAAIAVALWFAIVPLRLRSLTVLGVSALGAAPVAAWALSQDAFTDAGASEAARESVAAELMLLLVLMALVLVVAGTLVGYRAGVRPPHFVWRRRAGLAAAIAGCVLLVAGLGAVAASQRGVSGTVSSQVEELTSERASTPGGAARLTTAASSRSRYWREAEEIFSAHPVLGTGAGSYGTARRRYRKDQLLTQHAHGYVVQTAADLGIVGLVVSLALLVAWLVAASRTTGLRPRLRRRRGVDEGGGPPWTGDRVALCALALTTIAYGVHGFVDWTWFVPAPTLMAIAAAGYLTGRGPASEQEGAPEQAPEAEPEGATDPKSASAAADDSPRRRRIRLALAAAVMATALVASWAVWQPERADNSLERADELAEKRRLDDALEAAREASDRNPISPAPLLVQARIQAEAGRPWDAYRTLQRAAADYPDDPDVWLRLAQSALQVGLPESARTILRAAIYLDPRSKIVVRTVTDVQRALESGSQPPAS